MTFPDKAKLGGVSNTQEGPNTVQNRTSTRLGRTKGRRAQTLAPTVA